MSKIETIRVKNFKAIGELEADFKGCSAIVTGANNSGKTTFLRGLIERIRFSRPDLKVKQGEKDGSGELVLDSGERFVWVFDDVSKDRLTYISATGAKESVTKELGAKFFPPIFDIDRFLQSPPKSQVAQLQKIVGLDFSEIDKRYEEAYRDRTARNEEAERWHTKVTKAIKCEEVKPIDLDELILIRRSKNERRRIKADELNALFKKNQKHNMDLRDAFEKSKKAVDSECSIHNTAIEKQNNEIREMNDAHLLLRRYGYGGHEVLNFIESKEMKIPAKKDPQDYYPPEPEYITEMPERDDLDKIDEEITQCNKDIETAIETNAKAKAYQEYKQLVKDVDSAKGAALEADELVKSIEQERKEMIEKASFPKGISINSGGITVDGFALDRQVLSTSKLYTAALRIAAMNIGEVRTLHFDASFLDKNSLAEVNAWAEENDLQLLIERPDYEGGEIKYELIEG